MVKNINYEKVKLHFAAGGGFFSCQKETPSPEEQSAIPVAGKSSIVFFVDTFRVYTTDLSGAGQKLIVDEDEKSGNN
ncbi:MAG: hypothetical protein H7223_05355 [Pedobacter sp.]|nr:hypothetical protein [Pedobacter sp.]